jgi:hypothetical protein
MSGHVGFVVDKAALRQVFSEYFAFPFHRPLDTHRTAGNRRCQQLELPLL